MDTADDLLEAEQCTVVELLDRLLHKGVVLGGDVAISVADIELIYLRLQLTLCSVETARQAGWIVASPCFRADLPEGAPPGRHRRPRVPEIRNRK